MQQTMVKAVVSLSLSKNDCSAIFEAQSTHQTSRDSVHSRSQIQYKKTGDLHYSERKAFGTSVPEDKKCIMTFIVQHVGKSSRRVMIWWTRWTPVIPRRISVDVNSQITADNSSLKNFSPALS